MTRPPEFDRDLLAEYPRLIRYARKHAVSYADADDCAHEAIVRAMIAWEQFTPGTNFGAWLLTICRNLIFDRVRDGKRLVFFSDAGEDRSAKPRQETLVEFRQVAAHARKLGAWQHEILMLAAHGLSMEEMAVAAKIHEGTVKSRLSRARVALSERVAA